jgi:hypothetical protein
MTAVRSAMEDLEQPKNIKESCEQLKKAVLLNFEKRNQDIADAIQHYPGDAVLLVIGDYHKDPIKKLMPKNRKVTTSSNI